MLVLTLLAVNVLVALRVLGTSAVSLVESRIDVTVSFVPGTDEATVAEVRSYLTNLPEVANTTVQTPDDALAAFRDRHQNDPDVLRSLDEVGGNPFGSSLVVQAKHATDYPIILTALETPTYAKVIDHKNFADHTALITRINEITARTRRLGVIVAIVFAGIAALIIINTIRVAIYTFREEIGIMKLVGASNWFVRGPFLFEGMVYSLVAVLITGVLIAPILMFVEPHLLVFFEGAPVGLISYFKDHAIMLAVLEFGALASLSILTSAGALSRYLRT